MIIRNIFITALILVNVSNAEASRSGRGSNTPPARTDMRWKPLPPASEIIAKEPLAESKKPARKKLSEDVRELVKNKPNNTTTFEVSFTTSQKDKKNRNRAEKLVNLAKSLGFEVHSQLDMFGLVIVTGPAKNISVLAESKYVTHVKRRSLIRPL